MRVFFCLSLWLCSAPFLGLAQDKAARPAVPPAKLELTPMGAPEPALKYLLEVPAIDKRPGNAAVHYGKIKAEQTAFFASKETSKLILSAMEAPLSELKDGGQYDVLMNLGPIYKNMRAGARSQYVDWQLPCAKCSFRRSCCPKYKRCAIASICVIAGHAYRSRVMTTLAPWKPCKRGWR